MRRKTLNNSKYCASLCQSVLVKRILIVAIIIIVALFVFFYIVGKKNSSMVNAPDVENQAKLILVLDYGVTKKTFKFNDSKEERAWNLLQQVAAAKKIDLVPTNDFRPYKIGGFIDGQSDKHWIFYLDGVKQINSPYRVFVKPPAEVAFRYE